MTKPRRHEYGDMTIEIDDHTFVMYRNPKVIADDKEERPRTAKKTNRRRSRDGGRQSSEDNDV